MPMHSVPALLAAALVTAVAGGCAGPNITGRAVNEAGKPLPGVRIATLPETRDALAGLDGAFVIDEQLIGLRTRELPLGDYEITGAKMGCVQAVPTQVRVASGHSPDATVVMDCRPEQERPAPRDLSPRKRTARRREYLPGTPMTGL